MIGALQFTGQMHQNNGVMVDTTQQDKTLSMFDLTHRTEMGGVDTRSDYRSFKNLRINVKFKILIYFYITTRIRVSLSEVL